MKNPWFLTFFCLLMASSPCIYAGKTIEVEIAHGHISPDHLLLQAGDIIIFKNMVHMEGGHSIGIDDATSIVKSPPMNKGEQWEYEFSHPGSFTFFVQEHPMIKGKATVFTAEKMKTAVSDLKTEMVSYSLGYDFGLQVVTKLDNLDLQLFIAGLQHAYNDEEPKLDEGEMEFIIADYKREVSRREKIKFDKMTINNLRKGEEFLEANKIKAGVVVLGNGLQYREIDIGQGKKPKMGDKVRASYRGTFIDNTEFANTYSIGGSEFVLSSQVLPGIVEALLLMNEGSRWQIVIPPHLAYGKKGQRYADKEQMPIGPNKTLLFELELLEVLGNHLGVNKQ